MSPIASSPTPAPEYGRLDRALHRIALGSKPVLELSFDIERARFGRQAAAMEMRPPVFVTGLARAGTTIIMRLIHGADDFAALTYRDLPFPLAPNTWSGLSRKWVRKVDARERGHGDGLFHDLDSPEAIEEIFWQLREGAQFCSEAGLSAHDPAQETCEDFETYVRLICLHYGRARYLSKNNNNILRLQALCESFPGARLIHPFRDPLAQAMSLWAQHRRACKLAHEDPFRSAFMRWLGHHEFGAAQRPFLLPAGEAPEGDPDTPDFWLATWISVYRHLLEQPADVAQAQLFLDYDRLVTRDPPLLEGLREKLALPKPLSAHMLHAPAPRRPDLPVTPHRLDEARAVHAALVARSLQVADSHSRSSPRP